MQFKGMHHVTAVTGDTSTNVSFYVGVLGLRLVKKTVNQDDLGAYHLFYADKLGTAGTEMTFFDWPHVKRRLHGPGTIRRTLLRIPAGADHVDWWENHLKEQKVDVTRGDFPGGREALLFSDPEDQQLALVADGFTGDATPWGDGPVPAEHAIRGLLGAEIDSASPSHSITFLEDYLGFPEDTALSTGDERRVFRVQSDVSVAEIHIVGGADGGGQERAAEHGTGPAAAGQDGAGHDGAGRGATGQHGAERRFGRVGIGGVHHIAFRVETPEEQEEWLSWLNSRGVPNSGLVDRHYFRSLYFREPGAILFEVATAGPGFLGDEDAEHLGEKLSLPPFLEPKREQIEAGLKPIPAV